ncbi:MAG: hypothetical protein KJ077_09485 [Anaerolineae bacterium]|nr:hypothetical protein [Anaerolineae bacterium]
MTRNYQINRYVVLIFTFFVTINLIALTPSLALAELPPRPGLPPPSSDPASDSDEDNPIGGYIVLQVPTAPAGLWTVVQWQDQAGRWHDTDGWRGLLDDGRQKVWWIDPADFGKGPFQWAVYQEQNGELLASSSSFNLPSTAYETVLAEIELLPDQSLPQPGKLPDPWQAPAEAAASSAVTSTPDALPVTGSELGMVSFSKLALVWGVLLALINKAVKGLFGKIEE